MKQKKFYKIFIINSQVGVINVSRKEYKRVYNSFIDMNYTFKVIQNDDQMTLTEVYNPNGVLVANLGKEN